MPPVTTLEELQRQEMAMSVLENREQLVWHSNHRNESVAQTAMHFEKMFFGLAYDEADKPLVADTVAGETLPENSVRFSKELVRKAVGAQNAACGESKRSASSSSPRQSHGTLLNERNQAEKINATAAAAHHGLRSTSPSHGSGRRARSERSGGGNPTSGAKKRARRSTDDTTP